MKKIIASFLIISFALLIALTVCFHKISALEKRISTLSTLEKRISILEEKTTLRVVPVE